jgi:anti-anti-sigma regulatory factor
MPITLAATLDLTAAQDLKQELLATREPVIDASAVTRIATPAFQVLVAAVLAGARIVNPSTAFAQTAAALDLHRALKLEEPHV